MALVVSGSLDLTKMLEFLIFNFWMMCGKKPSSLVGGVSTLDLGVVAKNRTRRGARVQSWDYDAQNETHCDMFF